MKLLLASAVLLACALAGCADPVTQTPTPAAALEPLDAPADFRGTWILNTDRGENLGMMKAVNETMVVTQTVDQIRFDMTDVFAGMTSERSVVYDLNGVAMQNKAAMGALSQTVSRWDGNKLVTTWTEEGAIAGTETQRTETRWLSDGGKTLSVSMARGDNPAIVFVLEKAE